MTQSVIEANRLTKLYNGITAVNNLNLKIEEGEIFGFLGPNGAGKTTTILMLLGLTEPTSGEARICGFDTTEQPLYIKRVTGYMPENVGFYEDLTATENLQFVTKLNGISNKDSKEKISETLQMVGLGEDIDKKVGAFSKGMKQRLGIADVLVKDPKLVILDEPTSGIDPKGTAHILELIVAMAKERHISVLITSHLLHQIQQICDRVGIIVKGNLVASGTVDELGKKMMADGQNSIEIQVSKTLDSLPDSLRTIEGVTSLEYAGDTFFIRSNCDIRENVLKLLSENDILPLQLKSHDFALEEIYLKYFSEEELYADDFLERT